MPGTNWLLLNGMSVSELGRKSGSFGYLYQDSKWKSG